MPKEVPIYIHGVKYYLCPSLQETAFNATPPVNEHHMQIVPEDGR
jgi:hypothetical protein